MARGPLKPDVAERVRLAAEAVHQLDGHDRQHLDFSGLSPAHDLEVPDEVKRRLIDDPWAQRYARAGVLDRWRGQISG